MPIYSYRCNACGFSKDILQKISDPILTVCPTCHQAAFQKQVTAAGFQLKGSGWYVTDFKGGTSAAPTASENTTTQSASTDSASSTTSKEQNTTKTTSTD
jgi:putative FmdB family regulatory protein